MYYSSAEYCEMLILYGECGQSASASAEEYAHRFPHRRHPTKDVFLQLINRARNSGNLMPNKPVGGPRRVRTVQNEEAVLNAVRQDGTRSTRGISRLLDVPRTTVRRILKDNRMHPFHYTRVQSLLPEDYAPRREFCRWILEQHQVNPRFLDNILFTDESCFSREGTFNSRNFHIWTDENPHAMFQRGYQWRFSLNLWAGIVGNRVIGPFEFPGTLNGQMYSGFLQEQLPELLENVPLEYFRNGWFQHDGAPAHYSREVRGILDNIYPEAWIGRGGPVNWPARSPDLTPLDFFLWGHVKNFVYKVEITTIEQLRDRIHQAFQTITPDMVIRAKESLLRRARLCLEMQGAHFEHLL